MVRLLGVKGTLIVGACSLQCSLCCLRTQAGAPGSFDGRGQEALSAPGAGSVCQASQANGAACDFSRVVLASTEDVWTPLFERGALPSYGSPPGAYRHPTLVVFAKSVSTGGCGNATSDVGPFYCPADEKLYIDPSFYDVMEKRLRAPGDFAQAYVIAHEVGHHVQNLIGATRLTPAGETSNQNSVRVELQADCLAGVWGHTARTSLADHGRGSRARRSPPRTRSATTPSAIPTRGSSRTARASSASDGSAVASRAAMPASAIRLQCRALASSDDSMCIKEGGLASVQEAHTWPQSPRCCR